jgi:HEAT repeat protein
VDAAALDLLALDPVISVRQTIAAAAGATGRFPLLERMLEDPDPGVRRAVALALARVHLPPRHVLALLDRLADDPDPSVRAAAYVGHLLHGLPVPLPPGLDPAAAAAAVRDAADLGALREAARTAPAEDRRLAAALALAFLDDQVARDVARTDPVPTIRHRVSGALELGR